MNQPADRPIATRANDEQADRGAVQRQFLDWVAIRGMRLDVVEVRHTSAGIVDELADRVVERHLRAEEQIRG